MESIGAKLAVSAGSTAAVGGAGAGIYLTQGAEANAVETINEQSTLGKEEIKSSKAKENQVPDKPKAKPEFVPPSKNRLSKPSSTQGAVDIDSVLNRYWLYLLDTNNPENEYWWNKKYELLQKESSLDSKFQGVTSAYSQEDGKALNKVCAEVYKVKDPNFTTANPVVYRNPRDNFTLVTNDLTNNLWKFCSLIDNRPQNLNEANESEKSNGDLIKHQSYFANYLIATETTVNDQFWELKNKWFENLEITEESNQKKEFLKYAKTRNNNKDASNKPLKEICKSSYGDKHQSKEKNVVLILSFCSYFEYPFKTWFPVLGTTGK